jgi:hypothetical protein
VLGIGLLNHWQTYNALWRLTVGPRARRLRDTTFAHTEARQARGQYLAESVLACFRCHSKRNWQQPGAPVIEGTKGAGHSLANEGHPNLVAPNITPERETGTGKWTDDMLARAIQENRSRWSRLEPANVVSHLPPTLG